jgi:hypothetical protein
MGAGEHAPKRPKLQNLGAIGAHLIQLSTRKDRISIDQLRAYLRFHLENVKIVSIICKNHARSRSKEGIASKLSSVMKHEL